MIMADKKRGRAMIKDLDVAKLNCWEVMQCGCEPGGINSKELGICPAATAIYATGFNNGFNGGRVCWAIENTLNWKTCQSTNTYSQKLSCCLKCKFYSLVRREEGLSYMSSRTILSELKKSEHKDNFYSA